MAVLKGFVKTQPAKIKAVANRALSQIVESVNSSFGTNFDVDSFDITKGYYASTTQEARVEVVILAKDRDIKPEIADIIKNEPKRFKAFQKEMNNFARNEQGSTSFTDWEVTADCYFTPTLSDTVVAFTYYVR